MSKKTIVDKDYKEAFNLGYEMAKELRLETLMFKSVEDATGRMGAMQAGMRQYNIEVGGQKDLPNTINLSNDHDSSKTVKDKNRDQGFNLSI